MYRIVKDVDKHMSMKKAALLNAGAKYTTVFLQLIFTAILSRILTPDDYGIVAVINVFIVFFELFADMGFGTAVIQNKTLTNDEVNDIFTFTIYLGIFLMIAFVLISFPISIIYGDDIYISLGIILAQSLLFNSFNMIPNAILLKNKRFVSIAIRTVVVSIVTYTITILLAIGGAGVYALACNSVWHALVIFVWNEVSAKLKFKRSFRFESIKKVWGYSVFQFGAQTLNYFNRNLDNLLIGKFFSKAELGYYNKAYTLTRYPVNYLPGVITPVMHPVLSEHQDDKEYIYNSYLKILKLLSLVGCFGAAFCYFAGHEIISVVFGNQWELSVFPFRIISLSLWMQILTNTISPIYQSIGNTKLLFKSTVYTTILIVTSIICGVVFGTIVSVSICVSVAYIINFLVSFGIMVIKAFEKKLWKFVLYFWHEYLIFAVLIVISIIWPLHIDNSVISLILKFAIYAIVYIVLLVLTKQHRTLLAFFKKK